MIQKLKSMKANKKGFTLAELLIVVAILAVLAAIAVPVFSVQLDKARAQVDEANVRSAISMAEADFLSFERKDSTDYFFNWDEDKRSLSVAYSDEKKGTLADTGSSKPQSKNNSGQIKVVIGENGKVTSAGWTGSAT